MCEVEVPHSSASQPVPSRAERKARDRRKKACATLQELMGRTAATTSASGSASASGSTYGSSQLFYEPLAELLDERATMRDLWAKREKDFVFREMSDDYRPLPVPFRFAGSNHSSDSQEQVNKMSGLQECWGKSPLPGLPQELRDNVKHLRALGMAYESGNGEHLPAKLPKLNMPESDKTDPKDSNASSAKSPSIDEHSMSDDWSGWKQYAFGLEMQRPWAGALLDGKKTIETRAYDLPPGLLGRRIMILQSPSGRAGVSSMGNVLDLKTDHAPATIIGWCTFSSVKTYSNQAMFEADESAHQVSKNSPYGWKDGDTKVIYGWVVGEHSYCKVNPRDDSEQQHVYKLAFRRKRSLYQLEQLDGVVGGSDPKPQASKHKNAGQREKNKRRKKRY